MEKKLKYIDLFAGAGGLSEGFYRAGFKPIAHIEMDKNACLTLQTRSVYQYLIENDGHKVYNDYLKGKISRIELYSKVPKEIINSVIHSEIGDDTFDTIIDRIDNLQPENIDLIIGGPPCQAYSVVGRSRDPYRKKNDKKNFLYLQYIKFLDYFKPKVFLFENVPGLKSAGNSEYYNDLMSRISKIGYRIEPKTLNSNEFGALQSRKRLIFIGWKEDLNFSYPEFDDFSSKFNINDIFHDLNPIEPGESNNKYRTRATKCLKDLKIRNGHNVLTQHETRKINSRDREIYKIAIRKWDEEKIRLNYNELPSVLKTHNNTKSFLDRYKVINGNGCSHTIVAHLAKDGHYFIHPDINQARSLSIREAARIQSFPDDYFFEGSRTSAFTQIGNAVPVLMAEGIAIKIKELLNGK